MPAPPSSTSSRPGRADRQTTPPARHGTSPTRSNASPPRASSPRRAASAQSSCAPILRRKAPGTPRTARWAIRPTPRTENARHRSSDRSPAAGAPRSITSTWQEANVLPGNWLAGRKALLVALSLGSFAGLVSYAAIRSQLNKVRSDWRTVRILCAARDLPEGAELDRDMLAVRDFPVRFVTESFLRVRDDGSLKDDPVGQRLRAPLKAGDPILASHFEGVKEIDLSSMVNPRGRAVTIDVQERNAVGLWVKPNDHVDVIGSFRDAQTQSLRTVTLLQNVVVLATGKVNAATPAVADQDRRYTTVTLLVLPEEAEILTLAQETGTLTLLLRNPEDLDFQDKRTGVDQKQILTGDRASELQQKRYKTIQIIRGRGGDAQRSD